MIQNKEYVTWEPEIRGKRQVLAGGRSGDLLDRSPTSLCSRNAQDRGYGHVILDLGRNTSPSGCPTSAAALVHVAAMEDAGREASLWTVGELTVMSAQSS